jgi:hypothetical protein
MKKTERNLRQLINTEIHRLTRLLAGRISIEFRRSEAVGCVSIH